MPETFFAEMKRYVRFGGDDEAALRDFLPHARPWFEIVADEFYERLSEHAEAAAVLSGPAQVVRLKGTLVDWMETLLGGPWDEAYYEKRARIGRVHVRIALPQRFMFGAMNLIRAALKRIARETYGENDVRWLPALLALDKVLDLELAIMLEAYREAYVDKVQHLERQEKSLLERRLAISEARYEEIVEKGEALIVTADTDGRVVLFNRRCEELSGLSRADVVGRRWDDLPDLFDASRASPYEGVVRARDGRERRVRWHYMTLPGAAGPIRCAMGIDVTEEHDLAVRTHRAERLAALGTMAAGLAHEIRNPLNAAHLQLTLLQRRLRRSGAPDLDGAQKAAQLAASEMARLAALVEEFLAFARPQPLRIARADLRATAETIVSLCAPEAAHAGVDLALLPGPAVPGDIDDERVKQVVLNLVRNAVEATGRGGRVRVRVERRDLEAVLEVEDDGRGLPAPDAPIFEPFFTTKPSGTGLGLAIVHRIVTDHGGRIEVDSQPGRTVFTVSLPLSVGGGG